MEVRKMIQDCDNRLEEDVSWGGFPNQLPFSLLLPSLTTEETVFCYMGGLAQGEPSPAALGAMERRQEASLSSLHSPTGPTSEPACPTVSAPLLSYSQTWSHELLFLLSVS